MRIRGIWVGGGALAIATLLSFLIGPEAFRENRASPGIGNARALQASYERWRAQYERTEGDRSLVLSLGYSKGLSARFTRAQGQIRLDLADGTISVEVFGLGAEEAFEVWLVDNRPGPRRSVKPEPGDAMLRIGSLKPKGSAATLETRLDRKQLAGFEIDLVVVTRAGETPVDGGLLFGSPTLFQRIYYSERAGRLATFAQRGRAGTLTSGSATGLLSAPFHALVPGPAHAQQVDLATVFEALVAQGEKLFFEETFNGNGRTCGTCHPAQNNFTIDPAFIASLPANDPLFVAEFIPALSKNFENPTLMRQFGLILENVDGFENLETKFVMRGVPHTLALITSLTSPPGPGPSERTGWGGDGAPGSGSLRDFATGAVTQHFTQTLKRRPGKDFRLPTDAELDAMEAFQRSLGRQSDPNLSALVLKPTGGVPDPVNGKALFTNPAKRCSVCHFNAGANVSFASPPGTKNFNFDTGVENALSHPAESTGEPRPRDGGFGREDLNSSGLFGNGTFNTPPLVEAAVTCPCFHNNLAETIEDAVRFYKTAAFRASPAGGPPIELTEPEIADIGAFLRTISALEKIRSALDLADQAKGARNLGQTKKLLRLSIHEVGHAIKVLQDPGLYSAAVTHLEDARTNLVEASKTNNKVERDVLIDHAIAAAEVNAQAVMVGP